MITLDIPKQDYTILLEKNVSVPMRDGTVLRADVFRPDVEGQISGRHRTHAALER